MVAPEWNQDDHGEPTTLPAMVSSTDLFDGELFGDELMDIYNSVNESGDMNGRWSSVVDVFDFPNGKMEWPASLVAHPNLCLPFWSQQAFLLSTIMNPTKERMWM